MAKNEKMHFNIDASVVRRLGQELISDEISAIMELVKNSYDADADWVKIDISIDGRLDSEYSYNQSVGYINIEDNGEGMSRNDIMNKWLVISLSDKASMKARGEATKRGRTPLGDKGVGRLSTQRLGQQLELRSGTLGTEQWNHLSYDWRDFDSHKTLTEVPIKEQNTNKRPKQKGTRITITQISNPQIWEAQGADRFRGQLSQLIFPYKDSRPFNVYLSINGEDYDLDEISADLRSQAISKYSFTFDEVNLSLNGLISLDKLKGNSSDEEFESFILSDKGRGFYTFLKDSLVNRKNALPKIKLDKESNLSFNQKIRFEEDLTGKRIVTINSDKKSLGILKSANPGKFYGEIDEYDLRGKNVDVDIFKGTKKYIELVKNQVGVRIFRDGFGIKPYGFDGQDWLGLSEGQTSGGSFYGLRPKNVIGFVSINMADNPNLRELTSREGFTDSPYSHNFMLIMEKFVGEINSTLEKIRRSYNDYKKMMVEQSSDYRSVATAVEALEINAVEAEKIGSRSKAAENKFLELAQEVKEQVDRLENEPLFNQSSEERTLPLFRRIEQTTKEGAELFTKINNILSEAKKWETAAKYVNNQVRHLEDQIIQFSELAALGITAEALTHDIYILLDRINSYTESFKKLVDKKDLPLSVYEFVEYVRSFSSDLRKQLSHLAPSLRFNREKKETFSVNKFINQLGDYYKKRFENNGIKLSINSKKDFEILANKGKITQIIDNIVLNSEYWLEVKSNNEKGFVPSINIEINDPCITISDNGSGVAEYIEPQIFQPFVTSKPKGSGRGLGLFIVQQLIESMDGMVQLLPQLNKSGRKYIFQIELNSL